MAPDASGAAGASGLLEAPARTNGSGGTALAQVAAPSTRREEVGPRPAAGLRSCLVVVQGPAGPGLRDALDALAGSLRSRFPEQEVVALAAVEHGGVGTLVPPGEAAEPGTMLPASVAQGAIPGGSSVVGALLREGVRRGSAALALVSSEPRDGGEGWLGDLLSPVLEERFDYACPAYRRHRTEAALNTGIIYPLTRTLYGRDLRQPLGAEAAIALPLAHRLLADPDWRRDPSRAGSDAWLVAKVLTSQARVCQTWLGAWPRPHGPPEDPSQTVARALGLVFHEMERHAQHWQRAGAPEPVPATGVAGFAPGPTPKLPVALFHQRFQLGLRELAPLWGQVLSPTTMLALQRAAALPADAFRVGDGTWVRTVYDVAVAHMARSVERRQLLLSLTPLYLGWLASFARETEALDDAGVEQRVAALCAAFDRDKRYLIARWRWPDNFNP